MPVKRKCSYCGAVIKNDRIRKCRFCGWSLDE